MNNIIRSQFLLVLGAQYLENYLLQGKNGTQQLHVILGKTSRKCANITVTWKGKQSFRGNPQRHRFISLLF